MTNYASRWRLAVALRQNYPLVGIETGAEDPPPPPEFTVEQLRPELLAEMKKKQLVAGLLGGMVGVGAGILFAAAVAGKL